MAVRHTDALVDLDSRRILLMRQQEEGKLDQLRYVGRTNWNGAKVPIYVDAKELTIDTEPTDWSVHLGSLRIPVPKVKRIPVIRTVAELSDRGVVFETSLEDRYLVNAVPLAVHKLIDARATGEADQVYMLYPLSW
jgi:hypothetical protein